MLRKPTQKTALGKLFIFIAWILLAVNIYALILSPTYGRQTHLGPSVVDTVIGYLVGSGMLIVAAIALSLATYLHSRRAYAGTTFAAGGIALVLVVALLFTVIPNSLRAEARTADATTDANTCQASGADADVSSDAVDGVVTGILLSNDKSAAVVGGQLLYEGDVTRGISIVKIHRDKVEFEKNGRTWTQTVQQPPAKHWK